MSLHKKPLPPLPLATEEGPSHRDQGSLTNTIHIHHRNKRVPNKMDGYYIKLKEENKGLYRNLKQQDEIIIHLTQQAKKLRSYIKQQQQSFTAVFQRIRSAFEQYQDTMPRNDGEEEDSQDFQEGGGFSDSDNDYI